MFKNLMNNYYFGKAGKADLTPDDLPTNRWQLFWETLRNHVTALVKLNLMYVIVWLPCIIVLALGLFSAYSELTLMDQGDGTSLHNMAVQEQRRAAEADETGSIQADGVEVTPHTPEEARQNLARLLTTTLLLLVPCIAITGPATAGASYITRNWARDEHVFLWSDFKDAVKENWKQGLVCSIFSGLAPLLAWLAWQFYGGLAEEQAIMIIPQGLVVMVAVLWAVSVTYVYPMMVSYDLKLKGTLRNSLLLGVARLPLSVAIRLLHCVPVLIAAAIIWFGGILYGALFIFLWYLLIGFALSRFVTASYTNAVFDRFINSKIEGAKVNRGMRQPDEFDRQAEEELAAEEAAAAEAEKNGPEA